MNPSRAVVRPAAARPLPTNSSRRAAALGPDFPGTRAFTLLEVLIVIIVIGLLSTMVVGGFTNIVPAGREAAAVNKARIVNAARVAYAMTVPDSATQWNNAVSDADRSTLLVSTGALSGTGSDWLTSAGGYTLSLSGTLKAKTVLRDNSGVALNYPD